MSGSVPSAFIRPKRLLMAGTLAVTLFVGTGMSMAAPSFGSKHRRRSSTVARSGQHRSTSIRQGCYCQGIYRRVIPQESH